MTTRQLLIDIARSFNRYVPPPAFQWDRPPAPSDDGRVRPGDSFNQRATWADVLEPFGWQCTGRNGDRLSWKRPGKDEAGLSATTGYCRSDAGNDLLYVFSTNAAPFDSEKSYSKFAAYTVLNHSGDFHASSQALAARGYGEASLPMGRIKLSGATNDKPAAVPNLIQVSTLTPRKVEWLWPCWLPLGSLSILDGDPGMGKSTLALDLAARISRGWAMPPFERLAHRDAGGVLILSAEDDPENTIRPRLDAAGADPEKVFLLNTVKVGDDERPPVLPFDLELLADTVHDRGIALVIVDPFMAYLGSQFDAHKDQDIRRCLHGLALFARDSRLALLLIRHLNKLQGGPAMYRGGGSIGIVGAARSALVVGRDPDEEARHVLASTKSNLGPHPASLAYELKQVGDVARIEWHGETDLGPEDILWHSQGRGRQPVELREAIEFLKTNLAHGPRSAAEMYSLAEELKISEKTLKRAKSEINVTAKKGEFTTGWLWYLPEGGQKSAIPGNSGPLREEKGDAFEGTVDQERTNGKHEGGH